MHKLSFLFILAIPRFFGIFNFLVSGFALCGYIVTEVIPSTIRNNFTLYTALRLRRLGYNLMGPENSERVQNHFRRGTRLSDYIPGQSALLANLEPEGFSLAEDLFNREAEGWVLRPWIEVKRSHHEQPCAWYTALQSVTEHIVAEEFRDSRLEPHEYGGLGPEDEEPYSDLDTSDTKDTSQLVAKNSLPLRGRGTALNPDAAPISPAVGSPGDSSPGSRDDQVVVEFHVCGMFHTSCRPPCVRRECSVSSCVVAEAVEVFNRCVGRLYDRFKSPKRRTVSFERWHFVFLYLK
jgi:hypothetical protein